MEGDVKERVLVGTIFLYMNPVYKEGKRKEH